jgi:hypothetical protein
MPVGYYGWDGKHHQLQVDEHFNSYNIYENEEWRPVFNPWVCNGMRGSDVEHVNGKRLICVGSDGRKYELMVKEKLLLDVQFEKAKEMTVGILKCIKQPRLDLPTYGEMNVACAWGLMSKAGVYKVPIEDINVGLGGAPVELKEVVSSPVYLNRVRLNNYDVSTSEADNYGDYVHAKFTRTNLGMGLPAGDHFFKYTVADMMCDDRFEFDDRSVVVHYLDWDVPKTMMFMPDDSKRSVRHRIVYYMIVSLFGMQTKVSYLMAVYEVVRMIFDNGGLARLDLDLKSGIYDWVMVFPAVTSQLVNRFGTFQGDVGIRCWAARNIQLLRNSCGGNVDVTADLNDTVDISKFMVRFSVSKDQTVFELLNGSKFAFDCTGFPVRHRVSNVDDFVPQLSEWLPLSDVLVMWVFMFPVPSLRGIEVKLFDDRMLKIVRKMALITKQEYFSGLVECPKLGLDSIGHGVDKRMMWLMLLGIVKKNTIGSWHIDKRFAASGFNFDVRDLDKQFTLMGGTEKVEVVGINTTGVPSGLLLKHYDSMINPLVPDNPYQYVPGRICGWNYSFGPGAEYPVIKLVSGWVDAPNNI